MARQLRNKGGRFNKERSGLACLLALVLLASPMLGACAKERPKSAPEVRSAQRPAAPGAPSLKAQPSKEATPEAPAYAYDPKGRRDPFKSLVVAKEPTPRAKSGLRTLEVSELKLAGIVWENKGYYALVESPEGLGYVVRTGDIIGEDARVTRITPTSVFIQFKSKSTLPGPGLREIELKLKREE